jgi:hypothetical protein
MLRKRRLARPEMLWRKVEFKSFNTTVRISATHRRGEDPEIESQPWLQLRGVALQAVDGVTDVLNRSLAIDSMTALILAIRALADYRNADARLQNRQEEKEGRGMMIAAIYARGWYRYSR